MAEATIGRHYIARISHCRLDPCLDQLTTALCQSGSVYPFELPRGAGATIRFGMGATTTR